MAEEVGEFSSVEIKSLDIDGETENRISVQQSSFPYSGIFSPDGFLSTVPSDNASEQDSDLGKAGQFQGQGQDKGHQPFKRSKNVHCENYSYDGDLSLTESVFALDHILEEIMSSLDVEHLLSCRLVCHRWLAFTIPPLQKSMEILVINNRVNSRQIKYGIRSLVHRPLALEDFIELLKQNSTMFPYGFPCNKFIFNIRNANGLSNQSFMYPAFQHFIDAHGPYIHELFINCANFQDEDEAVKLVRKLITEQTPNLHHLSLQLMIHKNASSEIAQIETTPAIESSNKIELNTSLKVLTMVIDLCPQMLEMVRQSSLNLQELILHGSDYKYFTQPVNLVYLLKKIDLNPYLIKINDLESIARASLDSPGNLKLREICIRRSDSFWKKREASLDFELERRFVCVINALLKASWDSLESIDFEWNGPVFYEGLEWPQVMPKVMAVHFDIIRLSNEESDNHCYRSVFPPNFSFAATFPKLDRVYFLYNKNANGDFLTFLSQLNPQKEPILSVRRVFAIKTEGRSDGVSMEARMLLQQFFPRDPFIGLQSVS